MALLKITPQLVISSIEMVEALIDQRLKNYFYSEEPKTRVEWELFGQQGEKKYQLGFHLLNDEEFIIFLIALMPHLRPNFFEMIIQKYLPQGGEFSMIGGAKIGNHRSMVPTGETILFIIAGEDLQERFRLMNYFSSDHFFTSEEIVFLEPVKESEPKMSARVLVGEEWVQYCTLGKITKPHFGSDFPAKLVETKLQWSDLVINSKTKKQIGDIKIWLDHHCTLMEDWRMSKKLKPGFRALFYGPPGTGKTLTAALLGKQFNKDVYRIDLSLVVSKYIGETEKNLEKIFTKAQHRDWILFFDEADALFGKRSNVQNAHDKYANQEVSYLLQRVEDFDGLIILASNFKANIDQAFLRRFNSVIHFPLPNSQERYELWNQSKPSPAEFAHDVDLWIVAQRYELSGSSIVNIIHYASLEAIHNKSKLLSRDSILEGIKREYEKEERVFTS